MNDSIKKLIWLYAFLLMFEGSLRKWILPGLADALLIIRDPVVVLIYGIAIVSDVFPMNNFVKFILGLAGASALGSMLAGQTNLLVLAYGIRIDFAHLPLIWVMGNVFTRKDVELLGSFLVILSIPMIFLMIVQFESPMDSWVNKGVGDGVGGQIFGADGRIRPPGFFAFITGPQMYYPLVTAFFLAQIEGKRRMPFLLLIGSGMAIAVALPISISRTVMLASGAVGAVFVAAMILKGGDLTKLLRPVLALAAVGAGLTRIPVFAKAMDVFLIRWTEAAASDDPEPAKNAAWTNVIDRVFGNFLDPIVSAFDSPFFGVGIGVGSNVGAKLLKGGKGFLVAEDEWGKIFGELGPILGLAFIGLRVGIAGHMALEGMKALSKRKDPLPILICSASAMGIINAQWAPPTIMGFSVLGAGCFYASLNPDVEPETPNPAQPLVALAAQPTHSVPPATSRRPRSFPRINREK